MDPLRIALGTPYAGVSRHMLQVGAQPHVVGVQRVEGGPSTVVVLGFGPGRTQSRWLNFGDSFPAGGLMGP